MKVEYTKHAGLRLRIREIDPEEVEHVLQKPQKIYYDVLTRNMVAIGPRPRRQGHWLLVVYTREGDAYRVVTVIDAKSPDSIAKRREEKGRWVRIW